MNLKSENYIVEILDGIKMVISFFILINLFFWLIRHKIESLRLIILKFKENLQVWCPFSWGSGKNKFSQARGREYIPYLRPLPSLFLLFF